MTKEELEKATGQELIDERNYCGVDGYYGVYLDNVNAEMLKRFNRLAELEKRCANYEMIISKMEKGTCDICKETEKDKKIEALEQQIEKMKKYGKLLQDICTVMGNDVYMVSVGLENRVKVLWDSSEEKEGLKMVEDIENCLLKIKPQEWAEITKWEIKEK